MSIPSLILLPVAYVIGSIPFGVVLTRLFSKVDVQKSGSGNIGAHNVYRLAGVRLGLATLAGDILKGALPTLAALCWGDLSGWQGELWVCAVALSAFFGHLYSLFLAFKGGKGVATAAGAVLVLAPSLFVVSLLIYILVLCAFGFSSMGSLSAALFLAIAAWPATQSVPFAVCALVMAVMIFVRHRDNIKRLFQGKESSSFPR